MLGTQEPEEYARRFDEERLNPALQAAGVRVDAGDITIFELHHLVTPLASVSKLPLA